MQLLMTEDDLQPASYPGIPELICNGNECKPQHIPANLTYKPGVSRDDYHLAVLEEPILFCKARDA